MANFNLTIETDNAAFERPNGEAEIARILREVADKIMRTGELHGTARDINGNKVCKWSAEQ